MATCGTLQPAMRHSEPDFLHAGGAPGQWGSLGCWSQDTPDYASACTALARQVVQAAGLCAGARVLALACGAGEELVWLLRSAQASQVLGVERDGQAVQQALQLTRPWGDRVQVLQGDALALDGPGLLHGSFDQVLCVDAAYHLSPRAAFLNRAWGLLRPGGRLAYTDLCFEPRQGWWPGLLLRSSARLCGLRSSDLLSAAQQAQRLQDAGFADVEQTRLDDAVLGGFARFALQQRARLPGPQWAAAARRAVVTARLIGPCQAAGLGYVLWAATKPAGSAPSDCATAEAERTALSSSGTPASA